MTQPISERVSDIEARYLLRGSKVGDPPASTEYEWRLAADLLDVRSRLASLQAELESVKKLSEERRQMLSDISVKSDSNARYDGLCAACGYSGDLDSPEHTDCDLPRLTALETTDGK